MAKPRSGHNAAKGIGALNLKVSENGSNAATIRPNDIHDFGYREADRPPPPAHSIGFSMPAKDHSIVDYWLDEAHIEMIELFPSQLIEHERLHERFQKLSAPFSGGVKDV